MKSIDSIIVYFILCFVFMTMFMAYLAVLLRAQRMKFNRFRDKAAKIINQSSSNNAKLQIEINQLKHDNTLYRNEGRFN